VTEFSMGRNIAVYLADQDADAVAELYLSYLSPPHRRAP